MVLRPCGDDYGGGGGGGYVDCYPQNGDSGGHHFYESIKSELESFRLRDGDGGMDGDASATAADLLNDDSSSIASKKRIDSMFKATATRSAAGGDEKDSCGADGAVGLRTKSLADDDRHRGGNGADDYFDYGYGDGKNKNTVQEKIEKMFAEISSSELDTDASMESAVGSNKYHVQYIGCAGLSGKISSLEGLQKPVRDMYFGYRESRERRHDVRQDEARRDFSGLLEISAAGLTIRYRDELGKVVHQTNPFPSIAVWAALKYVCRRRSPPTTTTTATTGTSNYEYAFLPLIADPDGSDKAPLFRDVDAGDRARLDAAGDHAPVFTVVTRKAGKRLECHGFACETENDALLMAANLYGALVAAMSSVAAAAAAAEEAGDETTGGQPTAVPATRRVIRQRNGFTSMSSTAGSSAGGADVAPPALPPPRPPRRNKKPSSSTTSSACGGGGETSEIAVDDVCGDAKTFRMTVRQAPSLRRGLCNSSSAAGGVRSPSSVRAESAGGGDILTKVAIPRSRSFLGLASSKYPRRAADCGIESAADRHRRRSNGSGVMGFSDMFDELRLQEGLSNMDDILNAIINVEGMSFNDLKPLYREFLMKLAMTLTKDELYLRTKAIMTEQKRRRKKRRPTVATLTVGRGRRINEKLRDALNLRAAKSRIGAALLPDICKRGKRKPAASRKQASSCSCTANGSPSSVQVRLIDRKPDRKNQQRPGTAVHKRTAVLAPALRARRHVQPASSPVWSTSDDSDFFLIAALRQRQHKLQQHQLYRKSKTRDSKTGRSGVRRTAAAVVATSEVDRLHRTSSGYFSCSECSAVDDKCYCGGGGPASLVSCSCDSDSCADSDKCYCGRPRRPRNIFDELKSRGFAASESSVSRADSPGTAWKKNELLLQRRGGDGDDDDDDDDDDDGPSGLSSAANGGIEPSKSLEYLQMTRRPDQHYTNVAKPVPDRMRVYGCSSSSSSSLSATTVYSSSSVVGGAHRTQQQRRPGSSGSDNFRAIDYALFANYGGGGRKPRGGSRHLQHHHRGPPVASITRRSYSSEAVHLTDGYRVYHQPVGKTAAAARRHSVHDGGNVVLSSFFKSGIEDSLGYYP